MSDGLPALDSIVPDTHVTIRYAIFEDGEKEATPGAEDLTESYVHGYGQVFPALERGLAGAKKGAHLSVVADPDDAFGPRETEGIFEIEKDGFEGASDLSVGEEIVASGPDGDVLMRVLEIRPETVLVDTNHPLAGKRVRFEVDVVDVRPATEEEIEEAQEELDAEPCGCGHAHGAHEAGAHDHDHAEPTDDTEEPPSDDRDQLVQLRKKDLD